MTSTAISGKERTPIERASDLTDTKENIAEIRIIADDITMIIPLDKMPTLTRSSVTLTMTSPRGMKDNRH
jgi:hypothetical protein